MAVPAALLCADGSHRRTAVSVTLTAYVHLQSYFWVGRRYANLPRAAGESADLGFLQLFL